jgi:hypothetical protein
VLQSANSAPGMKTEQHSHCLMSFIQQGFLSMCLCQGQCLAGVDRLDGNKGPVTHQSELQNSETKHK